MTWAELRPAFAKRRYPCAERASAHGLIARNNHYHSSTGIPRLINRICEKALMYAFQQNRRLIDDHTIRYITEHEMLEACE